MALRSVNEITHFTHFTVGHAHHGVYAFYTMIMFGAIYYMMPRLLEREWPSAFLIKTHWWMCAVGITLMIVALSYAGWKTGVDVECKGPRRGYQRPGPSVFRGGDDDTALPGCPFLLGLAPDSRTSRLCGQRLLDACRAGSRGRDHETHFVEYGGVLIR
jgi:hypothetical protein